MRSRLRSALRLPAILLWSFASYSALVLILPLRLVSRPWHLRVRNGFYRRWGRGWCRMAGCRVTVEGTPPTGPFFLVSNHLSYMDIPLLGGLVDAAFVAKAELRGWPLAGHIMAVADTIFIDRGRKRDLMRVDREIEAQRERGLGIILFPEATSGNGHDLLPFKGSLLEHASRHQIPVHYATIHYAVPPAPRSRPATPSAGGATPRSGPTSPSSSPSPTTRRRCASARRRSAPPTARP